MYEKELKRIINASQNNALSFFVGAGVSALSHAPTWKQLINDICDELKYKKKDSYSFDECLQIPQMYYYSLGKKDTDYFNFIRSKLYSNSLLPNSVHKAMLDLHPVSFITTNYDTLIEDAATQNCHSFKVVSHDKDVPTIFGDRYILKLHGDFKYNNFVLKEEDYLNYSENFKLIETLMKSIFSTNTVVFIGYSLNDYNIKLILNWTKTLLNDNFNKPIFIHAGKDPLSDLEIIYQESKGLSVIDTHRIVPSSDYPERYESVFNEIRRVSSLSLNEKTEDEAFEMLYSLLSPLNNLTALRISDISSKIYPYVYLAQNNTARVKPDGSLLFKRFLQIHNQSDSERESLSKEKFRKYKCILSVFIKARVFFIENNKISINLYSDTFSFADKNCILFNYETIYEYTQKNYSSLSENFKKAFYFSRLYQYDESFSLFKNIAKESFKQKNYLIYYLAEANCIYLKSIIENINRYYDCYDNKKLVELAPNESEIENLFNNLPVEFRNQYSCLKDIHSVNNLYKYSYESFAESQKLLKSIETNTIEYGVTSTQTVVDKINDYMHFLQGNGIIMDVFTEYRSSVKNLMSLLLRKYTSQYKKSLIESPFPSNSYDNVQFDQNDFYCFIECFSDKELISVLKRNQIKTLLLQNNEKIEEVVNNLINGYELLVRKYKGGYAVIKIELQIRNCLALLRYVNISQQLVDCITIFILKHEFRDITIDDKIFFLDSQLGKRKMYSETTKKVVEEALINYLDKHITAELNNNSFDVPSKTTGINYSNLADYIFQQGTNLTSRKLNKQIKRIIENRLSRLYPSIAKYCPYLSASQKKTLITWVNKELTDNANMDLIVILIHCDAMIKPVAKKQLKYILSQELVSANSISNKAIRSFPLKSPYEKLEEVGYWCFIGLLKSKDYKNFLGNSALFDFCCQYNKFDFSRFDVSWLLNLYPHTLEKIANDNLVKEEIRRAITKEIKNNNIKETDKIRLQDILIKYFC